MGSFFSFYVSAEKKMSSKQYDVVTASSPVDLANRVTQKISEGWQPSGSPFISTAGYGAEFIQAIVSDNAPVRGETSGGASGGSGSQVVKSDPSRYYVVVLAGQSNGMAYGEGLPLPDSYDAPDGRIKQLARRSTVTPGGAACKYNDIIPADHCLHDVQDMSGLNHPEADLTKGQYGCVGQGLHIAKRLLPYIPADAGILLVPCCRGGSALTTGADGAFSEGSGANSAALRWGVGKPLYQDLLSRTKAALAKNPQNVLLGVVWMQGEGELAGTVAAQHAALFDAMVAQFRTDLADYAGQCAGGSAAGVPWICGDTTHYWKTTYAANYETVYGAYKNRAGRKHSFRAVHDGRYRCERADQRPGGRPGYCRSRLLRGSLKNSVELDVITAGNAFQLMGTSRDYCRPSGDGVTGACRSQSAVYQWRDAGDHGPVRRGCHRHDGYRNGNAGFHGYRKYRTNGYRNPARSTGYQYRY